MLILFVVTVVTITLYLATNMIEPAYTQENTSDSEQPELFAIQNAQSSSI